MTRLFSIRKRSLALITLVWAILQLGGMFTPGLLDDVDSVYIRIAREMLSRHDYVTPTIDGIRFFDKPPLMYWLAAGSMRVFGIHDWAARLPLTLGFLALLFAAYALGNRFFRTLSPAHAPDRAGLYAALALATSIGPYLYTRFFIPDMLVTLFMTLSVHTFLLALERARSRSSALWPMLGFSSTLALSLLTKGLIGIVFPIGFAVFYLVFTGNLRLLGRLKLLPSLLTFLVIALPWHILAALRNPAIAMPAGVGLPARAGWAWFYLYNEHIARFLSKRIPHDYGNVPVPLFWLLLVLWLLPWAAFLPAALRDAVASLRTRMRGGLNLRFDSDPLAGSPGFSAPDHSAEAAPALLLWAGIILGFFTISARQEYYHLPAIPALAILVGGVLAAAERQPTSHDAALTSAAAATSLSPERARRQTLLASGWFLAPFGTILAAICGFFAITAPHPRAGLTLSDALTSNPADYNLSLGHLYDLTGAAMGFFRGPLALVAIGMLVLGPIAYIIRRKGRLFAANLTVVAGMTAVLVAAHGGLVRFNPILGSKDLALAINAVKQPGDQIILDGELTSGSTLLFYCDQPVLLVNGRVNGPWFGSFWPDAPHIFLDDDALRHRWSGPERLFLLTYHPDQRIPDLSRFGPVHILATSGGKTILTNR
ncbi:MAG: glycosyltransferase family 39 protein [Acidobacteriaceae bacterium]|nr:glycosyltransferase family 39 protein [Acidobacteriaceae bacterium]